MVLNQIDRHQGRERVDLAPPERRSLSAMADRFETFAREECSHGSPMGVTSPAYALLSRAVASDPDLLDIALECKVGPPIPNLFFAAVKRAVADRPDSELGLLYRLIAGGEPPTADLGKVFAGFCRDHRAEIMRTVQTQGVQTNEIGRCSYLMPAFGVVAADAGGATLALVDVGASAGLNLLWDRYRYLYSNGSVHGPPESPVTIRCEVRSTFAPDVPDELPPVAFRTGIDLDPVDLSDDMEYAWMQALVWPDHADRAEMLSAARRIWLADRPTVLSGDAVEMLPGVLRSVPSNATLCVFHCHALNQLPPDRRSAFLDIILDESYRRTVYHIPSEGARMSVDRIKIGRSYNILSANRHAHGRWVEWKKVPGGADETTCS